MEKHPWLRHGKIIILMFNLSWTILSSNIFIRYPLSLPGCHTPFESIPKHPLSNPHIHTQRIQNYIILVSALHYSSSYLYISFVVHTLKIKNSSEKKDEEEKKRISFEKKNRILDGRLFSFVFKQCKAHQPVNKSFARKIIYLVVVGL